jgi:hypothetical protein
MLVTLYDQKYILVSVSVRGGLNPKAMMWLEELDSLKEIQ